MLHLAEAKKVGDRVRVVEANSQRPILGPSGAPVDGGGYPLHTEGWNRARRKVKELKALDQNG